MSKNQLDENVELVGIMPDFRTLYPEYKDVGEEFIIRIIKKLYLRDCLLILSQLSKHYFKYCQMGYDNPDKKDKIYMKYCWDLLDDEDRGRIIKDFNKHREKNIIIFPELSILHLIKLCLVYCDKSNYTKTEFSKSTLMNLGKCLLVVNSIFTDWQKKGAPAHEELPAELMVNMTKQLIIDKNFNPYQKIYKNFFIFNKLKKYREYFDIEKIFKEKYGLKIEEYFAFLFLICSKFIIKNDAEEDYDLPSFDYDRALDNMKSHFSRKLIDNLLINNIDYAYIDTSFFNAFDITKRPLVRLEDGKVIALRKEKGVRYRLQ